MSRRQFSATMAKVQGKISVKLIGVVVAALLLAGGAATFLRKSGDETPEPAEVEIAEADEEAPANERSEQVVEIGEFLVNLSAANQLRYLRTNVALTLRGDFASNGGGHGKEEAVQLPREQLLQAKDVIVERLSAQQFAALQTVQGRQKLKDELKSALDELLTDYEVEDVLFVSFVMQ